MTSKNFVLSDAALPPFSSIRAVDVGPAVDTILADYRRDIDALTVPQAPRDFEHVMLVQERLAQRLARAWTPITHLQAVSATRELRAAYVVARPRIEGFKAELAQNRELQAAVQAVVDAPDFAQRARPERALVEHALRDFKLAGAALDEPARTRYREIAGELAMLTAEFSDAVGGTSEAWQHHVQDERELAGIPAPALAMLREAAREHELDGYLVTLQPASVQAVLGHADQRALRELVYRAEQACASDQQLPTAQFDRGACIEQILPLRHEAAQLLGFPNAAEQALATRMARTPEQVLAFLRKLIAAAKPVAERELDELRVFARHELGLDALEPWDLAYASEKLRRARHALDQEQLKAYFTLPSVLNGLFAVVNGLYGITVEPARDRVSVWQPQVRYCEVRDTKGAVIAGVYLDLLARVGKRGGAWMEYGRARFRDGDKLQLPTAYLNCNFALPTNGHPTLLSHAEVRTLFREFGHGLQHLLTQIDLPSIGGCHGVEADAVATSGKLLESFCWHRQVLDLLAKHWVGGKRPPDELYAQMLDARHFQTGLAMCRELERALFDFLLHLQYEPTRGARALETLQAVRAELGLPPAPAWQRVPYGLTSIFARGDAAASYDNLWAEMLAADAFSAFEELADTQYGLIDPRIGACFRRDVLSVGASRPTLESFTAFRGRAPQADALLTSRGFTV